MPRIRKNFTLTAATKKDLKVHAVEHDTTFNAVIVDLIGRYAEGRPRPREQVQPRVADKVYVDPKLWEQALQRAEHEGLTVSEAIESEARSVLRS